MNRFVLLTSVALPLLASAAPAAEDFNSPARQVLQKMSARLGGTQKFTFQAKRYMDPALFPGGENIAEEARIWMTVSRPNQVSATSVSNLGERRLIADGQTLTMVDAKKNFYGVMPMRANIDKLVQTLDEIYGFAPPVGEFITSNTYKYSLTSLAHTIKDGGTVTYSSGLFSRVECHRIQLIGFDADAELWVGKEDHLPRKLVATFKRLEGQPQVRVEFSRWNLAANVTADDFRYTPPAGAEKITIEPMKAVSSGKAKKKSAPKKS